MKKTAIRENGLVGTLFCQGAPTSAIIVLGGSSGGLQEARAEKLAEEGFAALALAYFAVEDLPPRLNRIPLEYFEKAIQTLREMLSCERIGLWGISRGAELSLILGTLFPDQIHSIAAHVPSSAVFGAFEDFSSPAWLYRGRPIAPNAPFAYMQGAAGECENTAIAITPSFLNSMADKAAFDLAAICVEKLKCPLLLISAEDDQMWPSTLFASQIIDRLKRFNSPIFYSHLSYPGVGHSPSKGSIGFHPIMKRWFAYGGNPIDNASAAVDWRKQTISFFKESLSDSNSFLENS